MDRPLSGRLILVAEDEPLIALEITQSLEAAGARVIMARSVKDARIGVEDPGLSAAIMDHALSDGDSAEICARMKQRDIPYLTYSGYPPVSGCDEGMHVLKPASSKVLVATVAGLLEQRRTAD